MSVELRTESAVKPQVSARPEVGHVGVKDEDIECAIAACDTLVYLKQSTPVHKSIHLDKAMEQMHYYILELKEAKHQQELRIKPRIV